VDFISDGALQLRALHEETDPEIGHGGRVGKAHRAAHEPLEPGAQIDMFALDGLRMLFPDHVLLRGDVPLVGTPPICIDATAPKGSKEGWQLQQPLSLPSPKNVRQDGATVVIHGLSPPPWRGFLPAVTPPLITFGRHAAAWGQLVGTTDLDLDVR